MPFPIDAVFRRSRSTLKFLFIPTPPQALGPPPCRLSSSFTIHVCSCGDGCTTFHGDLKTGFIPPQRISSGGYFFSPAPCCLIDSTSPKCIIFFPWAFDTLSYVEYQRVSSPKIQRVNFFVFSNAGSANVYHSACPGECRPLLLFQWLKPGMIPRKGP